MVAFNYPDLLTNLTAGVLIIGFGIIVGNIVSVLARKMFESFELDRVLQDFGFRFPIKDLLETIVKYGIYLGGLVWGLTFLGLDKIVLTIVLLIILGLLVLFILLSIKDFVPNFMAGVIVHFTGKIKKGQHIKMESADGKVTEVGMLDIKIRMKDGDVVIIPHTLVAKNISIKKKK
tara:strand:- start:2378 stop:2905 length:528 start_codon:yes stop_codon:yes gene_type:complete